MSNGDDEPEDAPDAEEEADAPAEPEAEGAEPAAETEGAATDAEDEQEAPDPAAVAAEFEERLDEAAADIEEAETETERDEVETTLGDIESDLAAAEFPAPEDADEEDEESEPTPDYRADLEARLAAIREALEAARPPPAVAEFRRRFETVEAEIQAAETREEYDEAAADLDEIEADLKAADLPAPEPDESAEAADEDETDAEEDEADATPDYRAELETRLAVARAEIAIGRYRLRIDPVEARVEEAETEADLDEIDAALDDIESDLAAADLPEPDAEDAPQPREEIQGMLADARDAVEAERGPYAEDVVAEIESAREQIESSEWTEQEGLGEVVETVYSFLTEFNEIMDTTIEAGSDDLDDLDAALAEAADAVEAADLHPDHDAETIAALLDATDDLLSGLDASTTWSDLAVRTQLQRQGFYDRLSAENRKDFPPELGVVRIAEQENDPERILMALGYLESNFMEDNVLDALRRLAPSEAYEPMMERAQKRDQDAIAVLGKIGDDRAVDTFLDFIEGEANPPLQKVTLRALGEIGSEDATEAVAQRLVAEDPEVRTHAARSLGLIGDTRAVDPLADVLRDDEDDSVRAASAWALNQIGTEAALDAAAPHADDRAYIVQAEAEKAADALPADQAESGDDDDDDGFDFETDRGGDTEPEPEPDADEDVTEPEPEDEEAEDEEDGSDEAAA